MCIRDSSNLINDLHPIVKEDDLVHERNVEAWSLAGRWTPGGWDAGPFIEDEGPQFRQDLRMILVPNSFGLSEARMMIEDIIGVHVLEFLPPSGFLVRVESDALPELDALFNGLPSQSVPIEVLIDPALLDQMNGDEAIPVRIDGWRDQVYELSLIHISEPTRPY